MLHDLLIGVCSFVLGSMVTVYGLYRLGERRKAQRGDLASVERSALNAAIERRSKES